MRYDADHRLLVVVTRLPKSDHRDPDADHPFTMCVTIPEVFNIREALVDGAQQSGLAETGELSCNGSLRIVFSADGAVFGDREQSFIIGIGEGPTADRIETRMRGIAHVDSAGCLRHSEEWLTKALDEFTFDGIPRDLKTHYAKAVYQIICNTKTPRGQIGRMAVFPSRGSYASHYLWDACFTNLGAAQFNQSLAEDFLIALCEAQEEDGKIPQFVCATWNRPGESQPPLIAWSAWRLYEQFGNVELLRAIYDPLQRMVDWWFAKRDDDGDGVVEYQDPLESGWDNSPRFDKGRIAAVDLNSFLNREMRILGWMAPLVGRAEDADMWETRTAEHGVRINGRLFDRETGLFFDRLVSEDRLHKVLTPASFMPLWAGVDVPDSIAQAMIMKYLLNPKHFFGARPFPVVAYSDPNYDSDKWWRGPVWPNIAWAMVEVLNLYGFGKEQTEAARRLVQMMAQCDELNELYSSATGEPLGAEGLCWGCAVFMDLARRQASASWA